MFAKYPWAWRLPWSVLRHTMAHHCRKLYLPFPSRYQLQINSWIEEKFCVYFPFSVLELPQPPPQFFCVLSQSVSSYVINHVVSGRSSFSGAIQHLWLLESFPFLICIDPWALIGEVWCEHPFFRQSKSTLLTNESGQGPSYQAAV